MDARYFPLFLMAPIFAGALSYQVDFIGVKESQIVQSMKDVSNLISMQDRPPASVNGLRYRIASDIPSLIDVLHAYAYYDAQITSEIKEIEGIYQVEIYVEPGLQYELSSYQVYQGDCTQIAKIPDCSFKPKKLGLKIGDPALSVSIVNAELSLLNQLSRCGYPLAKVDKRRVIVDMQEKKVEAASCIQEGPLAKFGPSTLLGLKTVQPRFVERRIAWKEGDLYNSDFIEQTQARLLNSELFSSVFINRGDTLDSEGELPMKIRVTEAKHKRISLGVFYATVDGPGGSFQWTFRNLRGMGESLNLEADISKRFMGGTASYKVPDFLRMNQTYKAWAEVSRENIHAYNSFNYVLANSIERKINKKTTASVGLSLEHLDVRKSASNGNYLILSLPLFAKYSTANDILNPTKGYSIVYQGTPYQSFEDSYPRFFKQRITGVCYIPLGTQRVVLALRAQVGSIAGAKQTDIPLPKLFLGGSEDDLRGYRYLTVSPLNSSNEPLGGRSAIFATVENRFRITETVGIVQFFDFGTVSLKELPNPDEKWFKSTGFGVRYFTFFGPLRFDVGFPLNRRKGIDAKYRIYAAVGQAF